MPELLKGLLIALAASALTLGAHTVFVNPVESKRAEILPISNSGNARIEGVLARMEALLERHESQLVGANGRAEVPTSQRVAVGPESVSRETQEILDRLTAIERTLRIPASIVRELQPLDRMRAQDYRAIRAAIELRELDRVAFESDLHMRTMHEIVERFGYPDETGACGGGNCEVYWKYEAPSPDPESPNYFCLYFTGGLVMWTESRWTN